MFKRTLVTALALIATGAAASGYQTEVSGYYSHNDLESNAEIQSVFLIGTYYFTPVRTREHVLGEAAFLERASNISINYDRSEYTQPRYTEHVQDTTSEPGEYDYSYTQVYEERQARGFKTKIAGEWYLPGELLYLGVGINRYSDDFPARPFEDTYWNATLGITPINGLLVSTDFYKDGAPYQDWNLAVKYVSDNLGPTVAINTNYRRLYGEGYITLGMDYYVSRTFSVGIEFEEIRFSSTPDLGLRARKFFTDSWSVSARYFETDEVDFFGGEASRVSIGTSLRF